jgi:hypothetical protein
MTFLRTKRYLFIVLVCLTIVACQDKATIWSAESVSPDGNWRAEAHTDQYGGPGTARVQTDVLLKRTNATGASIEILEFENDSASPPGITAVKMDWLTPSHLQVSFGRQAHLYFQVVKSAGIDISVQDTSTTTVGSSR